MPPAQFPSAIGQLFVGDVRSQKSVQNTGTAMDVIAGSQLSAATFPATFKLARGGNVLICPQSGLSVNADQRGLMLGLGTGTIEIEYALKSDTSDTLVTPDFNIQLAGPGTYHFAIGVNEKGDTCVKPLNGNKNGIILAEMLGTSVYKTGPTLEVLFAGGKLDAKPLTASCGCSKTTAVPEPAVAQAEPTPTPAPPQPTPEQERVLVANNDGAAAPSSDRPGQVQVQVDTPFVFNARNARPVPTAKIKVASLPNVYFVQEKVDPIVLEVTPSEVSKKPEPAQPAPVEAQQKKEKKGFMSKVKGFFGSIFHR